MKFELLLTSVLKKAHYSEMTGIFHMKWKVESIPMLQRFDIKYCIF